MGIKGLKVANGTPILYFIITLTQIKSKITQITVDKRNWRILAQSGFFGSFDAPRSEWYYIYLFINETQNPFLDFRIQSWIFWNTPSDSNTWAAKTL